MNLVELGLAPIKRLIRSVPGESCFICRRAITSSEERLRLRDDVVVHRRCATYRMRNRSGFDSRVGFPR
jgi:hypothetical protein